MYNPFEFLIFDDASHSYPPIAASKNFGSFLPIGTRDGPLVSLARKGDPLSSPGKLRYIEMDAVMKSSFVIAFL